jgi:prophage regulatory protein
MQSLSRSEMTELFESSFKKQFLSVVEASAYTGFSTKYIYQLVHRGEIPFYKPTGRKLFFKVSELDSWIYDSRTKTFEEMGQEAIFGTKTL